MSKRKPKTKQFLPGTTGFRGADLEAYMQHMLGINVQPKTVVVDLDKYGVTLRDQNIVLSVRINGQPVGNVSMRRS